MLPIATISSILDACRCPAWALNLILYENELRESKNKSTLNAVEMILELNMRQVSDFLWQSQYFFPLLPFSRNEVKYPEF